MWRRTAGLVFVPVAAYCQTAAPDFQDLAKRAAQALQSSPEKAAELYRQAVGLRPGWAEGWFYLGASEYQLKRYAEAKQALAKAAGLAPENGAAWAFLGLAEAETGDSEQALAHIVKSEGLGLPDNPGFVATVRVRAALIKIRSGDFTAAVEHLRPVAMAGDHSPAVVEALGLASLTMPVAPADVPPGKRALVELAGRAMCALYAQNWSDAESLFRQLGAQFPNEPGVHYLRGIYYVDRDIPAALAEFAEELKISPAHVMARVQIAILRLRTGEPAAALEPAQEAVRLAPRNLLTHLALGRALLGVDKTAEALPEFQTAVKIDPSYPHAHFYLSQAYQRLGRESEAKKEQEEFTRLKGAGSPTAGAGPPIGQK